MHIVDDEQQRLIGGLDERVDQDRQLMGSTGQEPVRPETLDTWRLARVVAVASRLRDQFSPEDIEVLDVVGTPQELGPDPEVIRIGKEVVEQTRLAHAGGAAKDQAGGVADRGATQRVIHLDEFATTTHRLMRPKRSAVHE